MEHYAVVENGKVINIIVADEAFKKAFKGGDLIELKSDDNCTIGFEYKNGLFHKPEETYSKQELISYVHKKRKGEENRILEINGRNVKVSRENLSLVMSAKLYLDVFPSEKVSFKTVDGFDQLGSSEIDVIAIKVTSHYQMCFTIENTLTDLIADGKITTPREVDEEFAKVWSE
jgi:hypothetical protein